jgi:hypothetical protein
LPSYTVVVSARMARLHRNLIYVFLQAACKAHREGLIDPASLSIINACTDLAKVPAVCLALYKIRWAEFEQLHLPRLCTDTVLQLYQPKVRAYKAVPNHVFKSVAMSNHLKGNIPLSLLSYDAVAVRIAQARRHCDVRLPKGCKSDTHIFRHLWASWAIMKGRDPLMVSSLLGHRAESTLREYVHPWGDIAPHIHP